MQFDSDQNEQFIAKVSFKKSSSTSLYSKVEKSKKTSINKSSDKNKSKKLTNISIAGKSTINAKKQKMKLLFLIAIVAITFAFTWLPTHIIIVWRKLFSSTFPYNDSMYILKFIAHTLSYTNSLINPFIYVFIGAKFRNHIFLEFHKFFQFFCLSSSKNKEGSFDRNTLRNSVISSSIQRQNTSRYKPNSTSDDQCTSVNFTKNKTQNTDNDEICARPSQSTDF